MSGTDVTLVEKRERYHLIKLNRPDRLNALTEETFKALTDALTNAEDDSNCRAVLLTGAGRGFCAGQDLAALMKRPGEIPDPGPILESGYNPLVRRMRASPLPIVCAVNGVAAGAGASLALACDIVLAARSARFIQPFIKLGLIPDCGGTWFWPRMVGSARARAMSLLGETIDAERAEAWGLIWRCVDDASLMDEAHELSITLAKQSSSGLALSKRALNAADINTLDAQLDFERDIQTEAGRSADYKEGVVAFLEKRAASFRERT
jgi:2-(1,2-epoxy-1,2-dihydrophenyl)acetyl-CoA isomerase